MKIKAIAPWFGAKRQLAPWIVEQLGPHHHYCEPFCGSMAVLMVKPKCACETANDLHGDLINLARVLASPRAFDLYERAERVLLCSGLHGDARAECREVGPVAPSTREVNDEHVERAFYYLIYAWQSRNGAAGTKDHNHAFGIRYTTNGSNNGTRWTNVVRSIPDWHDRLQGLQILQSDAFGVCERYEDKRGAVLYVDPPYIAKGAKYIYDMASEDHARLAEILGRFRETRVVVSYYNHPLLDELYPGWMKLDQPTTKLLGNAARHDSRKATQAPEVLLINGPAVGDGKLFELDREAE